MKQVFSGTRPTGNVLQPAYQTMAAAIICDVLTTQYCVGAFFLMQTPSALDPTRPVVQALLAEEEAAAASNSMQLRSAATGGGGDGQATSAGAKASTTVLPASRWLPYVEPRAQLEARGVVVPEKYQAVTVTVAVVVPNTVYPDNTRVMLINRRPAIEIRLYELNTFGTIYFIDPTIGVYRD